MHAIVPELLSWRFTSERENISSRQFGSLNCHGISEESAQSANWASLSSARCARHFAVHHLRSAGRYRPIAAASIFWQITTNEDYFIESSGTEPSGRCKPSWLFLQSQILMDEGDGHAAFPHSTRYSLDGVMAHVSGAPGGRRGMGFGPALRQELESLTEEALHQKSPLA
jgi:hypothetical protein